MVLGLSPLLTALFWSPLSSLAANSVCLEVFHSTSPGNKVGQRGETNKTKTKSLGIILCGFVSIRELVSFVWTGKTL